MSNGINAPYGLMVVQSQIGNGGTQKLGKYNIYASANGQNTYAGNIFQGDMVKMSSPLDTVINSIAAGTIVAGLVPQAGGAANRVSGVPVGIFVGCQFYDATTRVLVNSDYWPAGRQVMAGTSITAFVNDDPEVVFKMQISTSTNNALVNLKNNLSDSVFQNIFRGQNGMPQVGGVAFTFPVAPNTPTNNPATGNTSTGKSTYYLDGNTVSITAIGGDGGINNEIKIIGLASQGLMTPNSLGLIPGVNMPFVDVLCKFNVHIHGSTGTAGVKLSV
jgi:hypothetical protein